MQQAAKKTGSVLYFEPLCVELNDCFGALKDVTPDQVFSNRKGMEQNASKPDGDSNAENEPSTSTEENIMDNSEAKRKKPKCK